MNPVLLRKQLQENSNDLQDFCKDLKSWGEEMKRKEEALQHGENTKITRNTKKVSKCNKKLKKQTVAQKPARKIGATDYAAWDKFDADTECEKLEDDINDDSELTDECNDNMQDLALIEKEKGNKFVKNQKWDEAIKCYSKAIEYYSYDPIFFANRALCYLKTSCFEEAENDCTLSLKLDDTYVKAYQRRAAAREGLNKLEHAEFDLQRVLELEPKNKESKEALEKLRKKLGKSEKVLDQRPISKFTASRNKSNIHKSPVTQSVTGTPKLGIQNAESRVFDQSRPVSMWPEEDNVILVKPIRKPPHLRSQKPLKRIKIQEVEPNKSASNSEVKFEQEAVKRHVIEKREEPEPSKDNNSFVKEIVEAKTIEEPMQPVSTFKKKQTEKISGTTNHSTAFPRPDSQTLSFKSEDFKIIEKVPPDPQVSRKQAKNASNVNRSNGNQKAVGDKTSAELAKPSNSVQFNLTWKNLRGSTERYEYLKRVDPQDLPRIFLNSLESQVFSGILEVMSEHFVQNKDPVFEILNYFTEVKRFGAFTMFMSVTDKRNLWKLFDYIKEVEGKNKEDVDRLIAKYEL